MTTIHPLKSMLLIAAAAVLCTGLQLAGIDALAATRHAAAEPTVVQLPLVLVTAPRDISSASVQQLPQVVVTGRRAATATAQASAGAAGPAS
jgi:hypothetical protein